MGTLRWVLQIDAPIDRVWTMWTDFDNFTRHLDILGEMTREESDLVRWTYQGPLRSQREFVIRVTEEVPQRVLAFKSVEDSVPVHGSVSFDASGAETFLTFVLSYNPPGGRFGDLFTDMIQYPRKQIAQALLRFKDFVERKEA